MKVRLVAPFMISSHAEGMSKNIVQILCGLRTFGVEASLLTPRCNNLQMRNPLIYLRNLAALPQLVRKDPIQSCEIIHYHTTLPSLVIGLKMLNLMHKHFRPKSVVNFWNPFFDPSQMNPSFISYRTRLRECISNMLFNSKQLARITSLGIDHGVVSSNFMREQIADLKIGNIDVIPNGVDIKYLDSYPLDKISAREAMGLRPDVKVILYYGHATRWKGIESLIQAMPHVLESFPNAILLLSLTSYRTWDVQKLVNALSLSQKVILMNRASDIRLLLQVSDIAVLPLLSSIGTVSHPNTLLEMMATGLPVISTNTGSIPEVVTNMKNGVLLRKAAPHIFANAINLLLSDEKLSRRIGREAKRTIEERFDWNRIIPQYLHLYDRIIEGY